MGSEKHGTIVNNQIDDRNGFILPIAMIMMLFFAFYTINSIDRLNDERDFLHERQIAVNINLYEKICVVDILSILSEDITQEKSGVINYPDGRLAYDITVPETGVNLVEANLNYGKHRNDFRFLYDKKTKRIIKWVD